MTDRETLAVYDEKADDYARCFGTGDAPGQHLRSFLAALPATADLLDLGCGPGRSAELMAKAGHRVEAWDASPKMVELAQAREGVHARQATFDALTGTALFDGIWANFSLLHATREDLDRHIAAIARALRPAGIFHIGMKEGTGTRRDAIGRRYTFVTEEDLRGLCAQNALTPFAFWSGSEVGLAGTNDPFIILQARKHD
jgi:SAM-dependent methyltransferase